MFQFSGFASYPYVFRVGWPSALGRVSPFGHPRIKVCLQTPRGFSHATTSFIASYCLGIHRMRLFTWPYNPNKSGFIPFCRLKSCLSSHQIRFIVFIVPYASADYFRFFLLEFSFFVPVSSSIQHTLTYQTNCLTCSVGIHPAVTSVHLNLLHNLNFLPVKITLLQISILLKSINASIAPIL